ncbi:MAG: [citrate (pro-3S)-lyase] ligase, partial [Oribacterium sp.]
IISSATFPAYFLKDDTAAIESQAALDLQVFSQIAHALDIGARFVGEEPNSRVTRLYNELMTSRLPKEGIRCHIIPRLEENGKPISASTVRLAIQKDDFETLKRLLPESGYSYFCSEEARPVIERIKAAGNVLHD